MSPSNSEPKPAILCLHGGGTTGAIFNIQTIRLRRELGEEFEFVFIDAPFESGPGPNVLPVFEGAGPFLVWINPKDPKNNQAPQKSVDIVMAAIEDQVTKTGKHFVGLMGFSEGARMVAGIALHQQHQRLEKRGQLDGHEDENGFLFAICLNGTTPPLTMTPPPSPISPLLPSAPSRITLPSIHSIGQQDPYKVASRKLATEHFDSRSAKVFEFNTGHHLPTVKGDSVKLANEIINLYHRIIDNF